MTTHDLVLSAMFAALIAALGIMPGIPVGVLSVPITLQLLGVMLAGALLGPWRGAAAVVILVAMVAMGLPVLAGGRGGLAALTGKTGGFVFGWIAAAFAIGWIALVARADRRGAASAFGLTVVACIVGGLIDYICGIAWLALLFGLTWRDTALGMLVFVPGDLLKAALASAIAVAIRRVHPLELK